MLLLSLCSAAQKVNSGEDDRLFDNAIVLNNLVDQDLDIGKVIDDEDSANHDSGIKATYAREIRDVILDKQLECYQRIVDSFPGSKLYFRALNNKASVEYQLEDYEAARKTYKAILAGNADDKERGGTGSGLMAEPYANYKNRAATMLAGLYMRDSNYREALNYLDLTRKYPYRHFCGNEYAANDIYMAGLYARCYLGLKNYEKAYDILLPQLLNSGLASNTELVRMAYDALLLRYTRARLKASFEKAFRDYRVEKIKDRKDEYDRFTISFLGRTIPLSTWSFDFQEERQKKEAIVKMMTNAAFYALISK